MSEYTRIQKDLNSLYPVMDRVPYEQREKLGLSRGGYPLATTNLPCQNVHAQYTGEKRCPKKGEWYLSGSIVEAYLAPNDLSTEFHIAKLVKTETKTVTTTKIC